MENVFDICDYFVQRGIESGAPITQISLQKLLYFSQGLHLAAQDKPIFPDKIYAWKYGPVVNKVYHTFKWFGNNAITPENPGDEYIGGEFPGSVQSLDDSHKPFLETIWKVLGKLNPFELVELTHKVGSPWYSIYSEYKDQGRDIPRDVEIELPALSSYFKKYLKKNGRG